jgi:hypothetical protein
LILKKHTISIGVVDREIFILFDFKPCTIQIVEILTD